MLPMMPNPFSHNKYIGHKVIWYKVSPSSIKKGLWKAKVVRIQLE